jgi:cell division septation protein DedD
MRTGVALVLLACGFLLAATAQAQGSAVLTLDQVEREMDAHRYAEARRSLARWWADAGEAATGEPRARGLFLRAVLGDDVAGAEQDLLRIAVEHPQSGFADRALFRLAQARLAQDDSTGAGTFLDRLLRDHPQSAHRADAARLLGRSEAAAPPTAAAPAATRPAAATRASTPPVTTPARPPARAAADGRAGPAALPSEVPGATYTVQVGSFARVAEAEALRNGLRQAGFDAFLARVSGSGNTLVRVGAYRERQAAQALQQRLRAAGHPGEVMSISGS